MPVAPFDGGLAVITGAGRGFGRATALALAERGATVIAADIDGETAERTAALAATMGPSATAYQVDVSDAGAMEKFAADVRDRHRVPDIVVNNAGIGVLGPFLDHEVADWERIIGVNLWGVIHGSRLFGAQMLQRSQALPVKPDKPNKGGHIVNIASAAAFMPSRQIPAYCTTKAAVLMLSQCLRGELAGARIGVTAVCPGFSNTGIIRAGKIVGFDERQAERVRAMAERRLQQIGHTPEKVAERIIDAIVKNKAVVPVGIEAHLVHAASRLSPGLTRLLTRVPISKQLVK